MDTDKETAFQAEEQARAERAERAEQEAAAKAPRITVYRRGGDEGEFVAHGDVVSIPMAQPLFERYVAICRRAGGRFEAENRHWILSEAHWDVVVSALRAAGFWVPLSLYQVRAVLPPWEVMGRVLWEEEQRPGAAERCVAKAWALGARALEAAGRPLGPVLRGGHSGGCERCPPRRQRECSAPVVE